jgi:hypothetical protein
MEWDDIVDHYRAFLMRRGTQYMDGDMALVDPRGVFKGTPRLKVRNGDNAAGRLLVALNRASTVGKITGTYHGASGKLFVKGIVLMHPRSAAGSLCLSYTGEAIRSDQLFKGKFQVLGGTEKEAKLRASGHFLTLQPDRLKSYYTEPFSLYLAAGFRHASVGRAHGLSKACRNAGKPFPPPPPPKHLKASFDGFALGPGGGTVYPAGATVTDHATCGQDLYGVFSYSGPAGGSVEGLADNSKFKQKLGQGKNEVRMLSAPADGEHDVKGQITAPKNSKSVDFFPTLFLSRNC